MIFQTSYASPYINTDKIDAAIQAVQCASDVVHTVSEKVEIGNVWMSLYFPIVMHTNEFYGCQYWETQELSDKYTFSNLNISDSIQTQIRKLNLQVR